ncbi:MAG: phosphatase PAP2 family protein [bacterium]
MSGPLAGSTRPAQTSLTNDEAISRLPLLILAAYLLATLVPLVRWAMTGGSSMAATAHFGALVLVLTAARGRGTQAIRDWIPLALGPFLYVELRWIIEAVGQSHADALVAGWESALFASDPSAALARLWPWSALSEVLHLCYLSYYALVYVPPALLWLRGRRRAFVETVLALVVVYAMCFVAYAIFPVDGPRFMHGPSAAPDGPIRAAVVRLLESGSSRGTAFPSSHVAASVVAALCALRFQRRVGVVVVVLAAGLALGAVYGGYHYAVDVLAGMVTGVLAFAGARLIGRHRSNVLDSWNL